MAESLPVSDSYRAGYHLALVQQIPWAILCMLMLDGGRTARICAIALAAFWVVALMIMARRPRSPTRFDMLFIRWAFFPIFIAAFLLAEIVQPYFVVGL